MSSKFKVGDKVIINCDRYAITKHGSIGIVTRVTGHVVCVIFSNLNSQVIDDHTTPWELYEDDFDLISHNNHIERIAYRAKNLPVKRSET
jgi:hypothetical protein